MWTGPCSLWSPQGNPSSPLLLGSKLYHTSPCLCHHTCPPCVSLIKSQSYGLGAHLLQNAILFPKRSHFEVLGVRTSGYLLGEGHSATGAMLCLRFILSGTGAHSVLQLQQLQCKIMLILSIHTLKAQPHNPPTVGWGQKRVLISHKPCVVTSPQPVASNSGVSIKQQRAPHLSFLGLPDGQTRRSLDDS